MSGRGRKGPKTRGGHTSTGHTTPPLPVMTPTSELLSQLGNYPPTFFAGLPSNPLFHQPHAPSISAQTMPHMGQHYQFGQPAGPYFHSMPMVGTSPQSVHVRAPTFQPFGAPAGPSQLMMIPTPSMHPHSLPSATPSISSTVPSASSSACPSSSTPVPESQPGSSPSVTTTARKGRKKRTSATVQLPGGIGSLDESGRLIIMPDSKEGFVPSDKAVKLVVESMTPHFTDGWPTWGKVPVPVRNRMFEAFTNKCSWDPIYDDQVRAVFEKKAAKRLSDSLSKYRTKGKVPKWIYQQNWDKLKIYWETPEFLAQSEQAKKNRASARGGSKHTCGSVSLATHRARYEAEHGKVSDYEFFRLFHYLYDEQGNEVGWVEPRAQQLEENYKALHQEWLESQGSQVSEGSPKPTQDEENAMFVQAGGGYTSKNRAYGLGPSRYKKPSRVGIVNASCSSSSSHAPQAGDDELRARLADMEQRLVDSERQRMEDRENVKKLQEIVAKIWRDKEQGSGPSQGAD